MWSILNRKLSPTVAPTGRRGKYASVVCLVLWTLFIWGNSLQPADLSGARSGAVTEIASQWVPWLTDHIVRKTAHFTEYAVLGFLLAAVLFLALGGKRQKLPLVLLLGVVTPLLDETIQLFVPGRSGAVQDVLLDCGGVLFGLAVGSLLFRLITKRRRTP